MNDNLSLCESEYMNTIGSDMAVLMRRTKTRRSNWVFEKQIYPPTEMMLTSSDWIRECKFVGDLE